MSTTCTNYRNKDLENNIKSLNDTVSVLRLKNGDLLYEKQGMILEKKEIEKYLDITKREINELEKKLKSKIDYISKLEGKIHIDTIYTIDSIYYTDNQTVINFDYANKYISLSGETIIEDSCSNTMIDNISISTPLKVGVTDDNKIFVTSECPYLYFTDIQGAQLKNQSTRKKQWNIGIQGGIGAQYDLIHKTMGIGPYIGVGISWGFDF